MRLNLNICFESLYAGKFGAVFASIPAPIIAALYCLFFAYVGMYYFQFKNV
jgi:nucleobase transporter 1/2